MEKNTQFEAGERVHLCVDGLVDGYSGWVPATIEEQTDDIDYHAGQKYRVKLDAPIENGGRKFMYLRVPIRAMLPAKYLYKKGA